MTIAWDQSQDPSVVGYRVYVGPAPGLYTETFDVGDTTSFVYKAVENRLYYLAIASYAAGPSVGPASDPVSGYPVFESEPAPDVSTWAWPDSRTFYESLWKLPSAGPSSGAPGLRAAQPTACPVTTAPHCITPRTLLTNAPASSLTVAPDGRLFVVENNERLRVVRSSAALPQTILTAASGVSFGSVALDPAFGQNGQIYLGETATDRTGGREFRVVRYRVLQNQPGERAVLVSIPLPGTGNALFALGADGRIHVAVPGNDELSALSEGALLRFNSDGTVPAEQRAASPVVATGFYTPTAIAIDPRTQRAWVAGLDRSSRPMFGIVPAGFADVPEWPAPLTAVSVDAAITSLAFGANQGVLFAVSAGGRLELVRLGQDGPVGGSIPFTLPASQLAQAVATDAFGQPYVAVAAATTGSRISTRLRRR